MKDEGNVILSLPLVVIIIFLCVGAAVASMALVSSSFGKGFAEGGGQLELFSDDIIATNNGDGVVVAAKDSQVEVTNTVTKSRGDEYLGQLLRLLVPTIAIAFIFGFYIYLSSKDTGGHPY